jgi:hypothetical protein
MPGHVLMPDGAIKRQGDSLVPQGVVCSVYRAAAQTFTVIGGSTKLALDTRANDPYGFFDLTTNRFQPKIPGYYRISANVSIATMASNATVILLLWKNGAEAVRGQRDVNASGSGQTRNFILAGDVYLNGTTDYLEVMVYNSASHTTEAATAGHQNFFHASLVASSVGVVPEPWHVVGAPGEPAFQNGWTNTGGVYSSVRFFKEPPRSLCLRAIGPQQ